jgi:uncharacterized membrane protein
MSDMAISQQFHYHRHWLIHGSSVHHSVVKVNFRLADSLILAVFSLCLAFSGSVLLDSSHSAWLIVICWVLLPPLLVTTLFFWMRDVRNPTARRQAIVALLLSIPVLVLEVWFFEHLNL